MEREGGKRGIYTPLKCPFGCAEYLEDELIVHLGNQHTKKDLAVKLGELMKLSIKFVELLKKYGEKNP